MRHTEDLCECFFAFLFGGNIWESNPSGTGLAPHTGFEDQEAHQLPIYPHFLILKLLQHHYNKKL